MYFALPETLGYKGILNCCLSDKVEVIKLEEEKKSTDNLKLAENGI